MKTMAKRRDTNSMSQREPAHNLGRNGPRNSVVNYTLFLGRSVVVAQTVGSLDGVYL